MSTAAVIAAARAYLAGGCTEDTLRAVLEQYDSGAFCDAGFDHATRRLTGPKGSRRLAQQEVRILASLISDKDSIVSYSRLMHAASCDGEQITIQHLRVLMGRLRKKFRAVGRPECIASRKNDGYVLLAPQQDAIQ